MQEAKAVRRAGRCLAQLLPLLFAGACALVPDAAKDPDQDGHSFATDCESWDADAHPGAEEQPYNGVDDDCDPDTPDDDLDGDGFIAAEDCDDADPARAPDAEEQPYNGVDDDCDPDTPDDDLDGDGFIAAEDCDDADPARAPDAEEQPYNGVDDDCDPDTPDDDLDGDGFVESEDCDDTDPARAPGAEEICGDGVINDCEGTLAASRAACGALPATLEASAALAAFAGEADEDSAGISAASVGDVTQDGVPDLLIGARGYDGAYADQGAAYLVPADTRGVASLADAPIRLDGSGAGHDLGNNVAGSEDLTGDGLPDLLISAHGYAGNAGAVWVVPGPVTRDQTLGSDGFLIEGAAPGDTLGGGRGGLRAIGDVDADGVSDLLLGAYASDAGAHNGGAAYLLLGPLTGDTDVSAARTRWLGEEDDQLGWSVDLAGDTDGDGLAELVLGAPGDGSGPGEVLLFSAQERGEVALGDALATFTGEVSGDQAGRQATGAGDVDGDGLDDLLVAAPGASSSAGVAYLLLAPFSGTQSLLTAEAVLLEQQGGAQLGATTCSAGDMDGDGHADALFSAPGLDLEGRGGAGQVGFFYGPFSGALLMEDADVLLPGPVSNSVLGASLAVAGDLDGDGATELLVGAIYHTEDRLDARNAGALYLFAGGGAF
ncbi:MAG: FG-GAP repeat protein [Alphaproteobacteria bacterium]|nr:FG-GAP repeat protein [Alphaproteobacteria bacterium]